MGEDLAPVVIAMLLGLLYGYCTARPSEPSHGAHLKRAVTPKQECERLMNELVPFAKRMLREQGELWPFGGVVERVGRIVHIGAESEDEGARSRELVQVLEDGFRERAGILRAAAIVVNVTAIHPATRRKVDAIEVRLDHADGYTVTVLFPYVLGDGTLEVGAPFATPGERFAFRDRAGDA